MNARIAKLTSKLMVLLFALSACTPSGEEEKTDPYKYINKSQTYAFKDGTYSEAIRVIETEDISFLKDVSTDVTYTVSSDQAYKAELYVNIASISETNDAFKVMLNAEEISSFSTYNTNGNFYKVYFGDISLLEGVNTLTISNTGGTYDLSSFIITPYDDYDYSIRDRSAVKTFSSYEWGKIDGVKHLDHRSYGLALQDFAIESYHNEMQYALNKDENVAKLIMKHNSGTTENYSVQATYATGLYLFNEDEYVLALDLVSSIDRKVQIVLQTTDYSDYAVNRTISLTAGVKYHFEEQFFIDKSDNYLVGILLGKISGNTYSTLHTVEIIKPELYSCDRAQIQVVDDLDPYATAPSSVTKGGKTYSLAWDDEFNLTQLDTTKWVIDNSAVGRVNHELQRYDASAMSVRNGYLNITPYKEAHNYVSGRISTKDKYSFTYGYIEARISLPIGQGYWPAFWMQGSKTDEVSWPRCGEIDVMESINGPSKVFATIHFNKGGINETTRTHCEYGNNTGSNPGHNIVNKSNFHTYALLWTTSKLTFYVDNIVVLEVALGTVNMDAFQYDFFIILNCAVGGDWPGFYVDDELNKSMLIDYVRVYQ